MDKKFYGRCHPDNIWALKGLQSCLLSHVNGNNNSVVENELNEIELKLKKFQCNEDTIRVACMCATK